MMTRHEIETATLDELKTELAAACWDSSQNDIEEARAAVRLLIEEFRPQSHQIQHDASGAGHNWHNIDREDIPANIIAELDGEMLDGGMESCDDYVAKNGLHYRW